MLAAGPEKLLERAMPFDFEQKSRSAAHEGVGSIFEPRKRFRRSSERRRIDGNEKFGDVAGNTSA